MKRSAFFKSLATVIAAPSVLKDVGTISATSVAPQAGTTTGLLADLDLLMPSYIEEIKRKYGAKEIMDIWMQTGVLLYRSPVEQVKQIEQWQEK